MLTRLKWLGKRVEVVERVKAPQPPGSPAPPPCIAKLYAVQHAFGSRLGVPRDYVAWLYHRKRLVSLAYNYKYAGNPLTYSVRYLYASSKAEAEILLGKQKTITMIAPGTPSNREAVANVLTRVKQLIMGTPGVYAILAQYPVQVASWIIHKYVPGTRAPWVKGKWADPVVPGVDAMHVLNNDLSSCIVNGKPGSVDDCANTPDAYHYMLFINVDQVVSLIFVYNHRYQEQYPLGGEVNA